MPVWASTLINEKPFTCLYHECNVTLFSSEVSSYAEKTSLIPVCAIFNQMFIFHQMIALQKLWKVFFISSKKLFLFLRYSIFCIFVFPPFFSLSAIALEVDLRKILKVINGLNRNLITYFVWYLDKEKRCDIETLFLDRLLNTERFYGKIMQNLCTKS